jgi:hypothetical protein
MIEDMRVRGFSEKTRNDYIRNVRAFAAFIGRSPDTAPPGADRRAAANHQQCSRGLAFLLHRDARTGPTFLAGLRWCANRAGCRPC